MKKFTRIKQDSIFGGVCNGISEYADIDVSLIRIGMLCLIFTPVPIVILYCLSCLIIPTK